jgi:hypothetical protein
MSGDKALLASPLDSSIESSFIFVTVPMGGSGAAGVGSGGVSLSFLIFCAGELLAGGIVSAGIVGGPLGGTLEGIGVGGTGREVGLGTICFFWGFWFSTIFSSVVGITLFDSASKAVMLIKVSEETNVRPMMANTKRLELAKNILL